MACTIINACAVLHNMCFQYIIQVPDNDEPHNNFGVNLNDGHDNENNRDDPVRRVNLELNARRTA